LKSSTPSFIYLAADHTRLALAEVQTLLELQQCRVYTMISERIIRVDDRLDTAQIMRRAALVKYAGQILLKVPDMSHTTLGRIPWKDILDAEPFILAVDPANLPHPQAVSERIIRAVKEKCPEAQPRPSKARRMLHIFSGQEGFYICESQRPPSRRWVDRRPRARAFFHPTALHPRLARCLVNLTAARPGEVLLDPFCGTGSIMIEAGLLGITPLGIELSPRMIRGAQTNLKQFGIEDAQLILGDGTRPPHHRIDAVATDLPYGRGSKTMGRDPREIARDFIEHVVEILPQGARCVVLHPKDLPIGHRRAEAKFTYEIPVHRHLTRMVTVLEMS
jgi:tRNA (guanine10-N2)-dimethyltransferase